MMSTASTGVPEERSITLEDSSNRDGCDADDHLANLSKMSELPTANSKADIDSPFGANNEITGQPSSPPHNYRHSRAYRHFKNPPQPHMCIRVTTLTGDEVFINVLSWTRIVVPQEPTDPIPLYGGMRVPPGSPRCPNLIYAVMANPEVLKDSGRHSKDPEERRAMVELMCDFVEAMNPDLKLNRNAVILKDRDISGELKDIWNAVQAQRDREREEQIMQQHNHVPPPQQMFLPQQKPESSQQTVAQQSPLDDQNVTDNKITYMEFGPATASSAGVSNNPSSSDDDVNSEPKSEPMSIENHVSDTTQTKQSAINSNTDEPLNDLNDALSEKVLEIEVDQTDSKSQVIATTPEKQSKNNKEANSNKPTMNSKPASVNESKIPLSKKSSTTNTPTNVTSTISNTTTTITTTSTTTTNSTKKEKLGGFLPNSCIFPRFKNKHKDKEKDKDKEKNASNHTAKEKSILNSMKKTTTAATNAFTKSQSNADDIVTVNKQHCLSLEAQVEKLDLNKMETHSNDVMIKVATSPAK